MDWVDGFWGMEACQQLIDLLQRERQRRPSGAEVVSASIFFFLCGLQSLQLFSLQDIMLPKYHFWGFKDWCKNYSQRFKGFLKHFIKDLINNMSTGETMRLTKCHKWAPLFPLVTVLPPLRCSSRMSPSSSILLLHPPPPPPPSSSSSSYNSNCRSFESALLFTCSYFWQHFPLNLHLIDIVLYCIVYTTFALSCILYQLLQKQYQFLKKYLVPSHEPIRDHPDWTYRWHLWYRKHTARWFKKKKKKKKNIHWVKPLNYRGNNVVS